MRGDFLTRNGIKSQAGPLYDGTHNGYVEYGYGQVEPNHLSAQKTGQIYAQLPAASSINILENGQFVKYDYENGVVNFSGDGEWYLVFNEIKLYRDDQPDCEFAMKKADYAAHVYSPVSTDPGFNALQSRYYNGTAPATPGDTTPILPNPDKVTTSGDIYEPDYEQNPFKVYNQTTPAMMPAGTTMVPRCLKTNIGDIYTTNLIRSETLALGNSVYVGDLGILAKAGDNNVPGSPSAGTMEWKVVKVYTLPDHQKAVKLMRIA